MVVTKAIATNVPPAVANALALLSKYAKRHRQVTSGAQTKPVATDVKATIATVAWEATFIAMAPNAVPAETCMSVPMVAGLQHLVPMVVTTTAAHNKLTATSALQTAVLVAETHSRFVPQRALAISMLEPCVVSAATTVTATSVAPAPVLVAAALSKFVLKPAPATSTTTPLVLMDAPMDTATLVPLVVTSAMAQPLSNA